MLARAHALLCFVLAALLAQIPLATPSTAQDYPNRSLRLYQGFPVGGNADIIARAMGEEIAKRLGQQVIVEARPGASGNLATEQVVRAEPDGHALVLFTAAHMISPALLKAVSFDAAKDLEYVSVIADFAFVVAVHNDSPFKTITDLVEHARKNPDSLTWGTAGTGSGQHMCGELMAHTARFKARHVPFRGDAGSVTGLLSKSVDFIVAPSTVLVGNIQGGNFRALAVSARSRAPALPDVPTMSEALKIDIDMRFPQGIATTKGTPKAIVERLAKVVREAVATPAMDKRLRDLGGIPSPTTPQETAKMVEEQLMRWKEVVSAAGIKPQ